MFYAKKKNKFREILLALHTNNYNQGLNSVLTKMVHSAKYNSICYFLEVKTEAEEF